MDSKVGLAVEVLRRGGVVALPTDTVYGLGANPFDDAAVDRVYEIKGRPRYIGLPLLVGSVSQLELVTSHVPDIAWLLARRFLPGGLTLILHKSASVPPVVSGGGDTVAIRVPNHPVPIAVIEGLGGPITGTSANLTGRRSPVTAQEVRDQLGDTVDLIVDGGRCPRGVDSTVIDFSGERPRIVREGAVSRDEIERVCGEHVF